MEDFNLRLQECVPIVCMPKTCITQHQDVFGRHQTHFVWINGQLGKNI
jgi:hypothetical protein